MTDSTQRTLLSGRLVVTLAEPPLIDDGAILVEDGRVAWVGERHRVPMAEPFDQIIDHPDSILMPGLTNAHAHSDFELPWRWLEYPIERGGPHASVVDASEELAYLTAVARLANSMRAGQTSVLDFVYGRPNLDLLGYDALVRAYQDVGLRGTLALAMRDRSLLAHGLEYTGDPGGGPGSGPTAYGVPVPDQFAALEALTTQIDGDPRLQAMIAPDWTPTCSDQLLVRCADAARERGCGLTIHVLETRMELEYASRSSPRTTMARLDELGVLGPRTSCAHFVWATDEDIAILAETGSTAVFNPGSNLRLGSGIPRIREVLNAGARFAFGTDSLSFATKDDMFEEIRLGEHLARVTDGIEGGRLSSVAMLEGACATGALAAGNEGAGRIRVGAQADLLVLDGRRLFDLAETTAASVLDLLIDAGTSDDVRTVLVGGVVVVDEGQVMTVDETAVAKELARAQATGNRVPRNARAEMALDDHVLDYYRSWSRRAVDPATAYNARTVAPW